MQAYKLQPVNSKKPTGGSIKYQDLKTNLPASLRDKSFLPFSLSNPATSRGSLCRGFSEFPRKLPAFHRPWGWHHFCALLLSSISWIVLTPSYLPHPANPKFPPTEQAQLRSRKTQFLSFFPSLPLVPPHRLWYFPLCCTATGLFYIKHILYCTIYCKETEIKHHRGRRTGQGSFMDSCRQPSTLVLWRKGVWWKLKWTGIWRKNFSFRAAEFSIAQPHSSAGCTKYFRETKEREKDYGDTTLIEYRG